jgi:hypothetical protein
MSPGSEGHRLGGFKAGEEDAAGKERTKRVPMTVISAVRMATSAKTQRKPAASPRKPPTMANGEERASTLGQGVRMEKRMINVRPTAGPRNGAEAKMAMAMPRCAAENMSEMDPPALVSGEEPAEPEKKRRTGKVGRVRVRCIHAGWKTH